MSREDLRLCQQNEIEVIKAIYVGDVLEDDESDDEPKQPLEFTVRLLPQKGSSGGGDSFDQKVPTFIVIHFRLPPEYPYKVPQLWIQENKGLSVNEVLELESELKNLAEKCLGEVMIYQLLTTAEAYLYNHQKRPTGSFHDEMLMRRKELEEQSMRMQIELKEKERMVIREEILKKQEELKEEIRKQKEQRKSQPNSSPPNSLQSSPTKTDGFPPSLKYKSGKRKSVSGGRRGRSNSEGSDSSHSDSSELTILEFQCGKSTNQFHRGEIIGRSSRGSTVYAGMSRSGSLVAISEWKFVTKLDKKGRELRAVSGCGDSMSFDALTKQVNSYEAEMNLFQKLEHSNIVLYYGIKVYSPCDEPGVLYVYLAEEFVRGTTLQSYLQDTLALDLSLVRHCAKGILEGLKFLHVNDVVHRFLRDTSVFLDTNGEIKLTDYGVERKICEVYQSFCRIPEVPDKFPPSIGRGGKKGDIYRFGVIILSLIKGQYAQSPPEIPTTFPSELQDFLKRCLTSIENSRWSASDLLEHPFIKMTLQRGPTVRFFRQNSVDQENQNLEDKSSPEDEGDLQFLPRFIKGHSRVQNEFEIMKWLGKGGFGDVLKVKNKLDSRVYALKRIRLNPKNKQLNKKITREVKLLSQLNHENVVRYFNSWIETVIESDDEGTSTEAPSTDITTPIKPNQNLPSVRFQNVNPFMQNSLGMLDNIEDLAPPMMNDSEWSVSVAHQQPLSSDSDSSEDDEDIFGTSFLRVVEENSEEVVFETDSCSEPQEDSSFSKDNRIEKEPEVPTQNGENGRSSSEFLSMSGFVRESQFMYIQMEFCEKSTLKTAIDDNLSEDLDRAWRLFREIVEGLVHIHQQGMIHRDLKPVNIFLDSSDSVKIGDFGLATSSIITKGSEDTHILEKEADGGGHSIDFQDESRTGQVGTALYVAPELITTGLKISYNQKVDIYSLGIIFFEMFYHPPQTSMERVRVIAGLRKDPMEFPSDFDQQLIPQVTHITKWLLNKQPNKRPTSLELLQSDYLPPPHLEEAELRDIFSRTLNNSQSKAYKYLVASCFKQKLSTVDDITFDMESGKLIQEINYSRSSNFVQRVKQVIQNVFVKHGAIEVNTPLLMPKSTFYENSETCVNLMCHSGSIVSLPHDLRIPFARYVGRYGISHMKRYSIDKVFRERKVHGLHPRELIECAFDIVDSSQGSLISDGEVLSVMFEIIHELPWLRNKACTIRLGHTKLLQGVLLHCGVNEEHHQQIIKILADVKVERESKSQIQTHLCSLGLPDHFITMLFTLMEVEGSFAKISNLLKGITKRKGEAASCIKEGLHELEILISNIENFGLKCTLAVAPTMTFGSHIYSGLLFQIVCNLKRRKNKMTLDVIAAGGRYDALIQSLRTTLSLEPDASINSRDLKQCGVGISISLDKLIAGFEGEDECDWGNKGSVDAIICSLGHHPMSKEKIDLMKEFLAHGIHSSILGDTQTLETAEEFCKEIGATFLVILKEGEFYSNIRVRIWERGRFNERKMTKQEVIDLITRSLEVGLEGSGSSLYASGITKSESGPVKQIGSSAEASSTSVPVGSHNSMPSFNISFVVQEREKLANWKRRFENQVMSRIQEILPKLAKQQTVEVLGLEVNALVINTLASCLSLHDKDEFSKGVGEAIEKHPRLKKYLNTICDDIYELTFGKTASVIIIYGLVDNSYRVLL